MVTDYLRNMRFYHKSKVDRVVAFKVLDPYNTLVKLDDGSQHIFNEETTVLRRLPDPNYITDEEYRCELGRAIERAMHNRMISQVELSDITGIPQPTISSYIKGRINPSFHNLDKIAKALGYSMDEFRMIEL